MTTSKPQAQTKQEETTVNSLISEFEINQLMTSIIDHCFDRWSEKDILVVKRIQELTKTFLERKLAHELTLQAQAHALEMANLLNEFRKVVDPQDYQWDGGKDAWSAHLEALKDTEQEKV